MDTQYKMYRAETRGIDEQNGMVDLYIPMSTQSVDRDGEVIAAGAWRKTLPNFKKHPVLLSSHDYGDLRKQIGQLTGLKITDSGLLAKPLYYINQGNEEADWAFNLAKKGMAAFSVGFIPKKWEDGHAENSPRRTYTEVELLEISQVCVPSNRDAIQGVRSKSADPVVLRLCDEVEKMGDPGGHTPVRDKRLEEIKNLVDEILASGIYVPQPARVSVKSPEDELAEMLRFVERLIEKKIDWYAGRID